MMTTYEVKKDGAWWAVWRDGFVLVGRHATEEAAHAYADMCRAALVPVQDVGVAETLRGAP